MLFAELAADLANEELSPLDLHVFADRVTVSCLFLFHVLKLEWEAKLEALSIHVALLHELEGLL